MTTQSSLRPQRVKNGPGAWARGGTAVAYVRSQCRPVVLRGIGEIHLAASELPIVRAVIECAVAARAVGARQQTASATEITRLRGRYPSQ